MIKIIKGQKYQFNIVHNRNQFYIEALHLKSRRYSSINNLNSILSALDIGYEDERIENSHWDTDADTPKFFRETVDFLSDKEFRDYIEDKLDDDRQAGEWENRRAKLV